MYVCMYVCIYIYIYVFGRGDDVVNCRLLFYRYFVVVVGLFPP